MEAAALALAKDYQPLDDLRGSAAYRRTAAANLLRRLWPESRRARERARWLTRASPCTARCTQPLPHDSADAPCRRHRALCRRPARAAGHCSISPSASRADGHAPAASALDLAAVRAAPGVVAVFTAADIPGENDVSPVAA